MRDSVRAARSSLPGKQCEGWKTERIPLPPSAFPPRSIRPNRGRVVQQEISWATQCVVRVSSLRDRRPRRKVVVVIARRAAAAERAATTRRRAAAAVVAIAVRAMQDILRATLAVRTYAAAAIDVTHGVTITVAAPIWRTARRAVIRATGISPTCLTAVAVEHTTVAARATTFQIAAATTRVAAFRQAEWPRSISCERSMAWFATRATRITAGLTTVWTNRSTANGRQHR